MGYGINIFVPRPLHYVTRSPGIKCAGGLNTNLKRQVIVALLHKGHVTRSNFSCNLQRNKRCVASCKKKFTIHPFHLPWIRAWCNTPFCNCNCCVASCKKSRTTLYFSQRCETSCLSVTSPLQLATQFCQNWPIRAYLSQDVCDLAPPPSCLLLYALQVAKNVANV